MKMEKNAMIIYGNEEKSQQTGSFMETRLNSVIEKMKSKNIERNELVSLEEIKSFEKKIISNCLMNLYHFTLQSVMAVK